MGWGWRREPLLRWRELARFELPDGTPRPPSRPAAIVGAMAAMLALFFLAAPGWALIAKDQWVDRNGATAVGSTGPRGCNGCPPLLTFTAADGSTAQVKTDLPPDDSEVAIRYVADDPERWVVAADDGLLDGSSGGGLLFVAVGGVMASSAGVFALAAERGRRVNLAWIPVGVAALEALAVASSFVLPLHP